METNRRWWPPRTTIWVALCMSLVGGTAFGQTVPDFLQKHPDLPGGGNQYCAPAAVSNSLVAMAQGGYGGLASGSQLDLVKLLGSAPYMDTSLENGTGACGLMRGVARYVEARGYAIRSLDYRGWRLNGCAFGDVGSSLEPSFVRNSTLDGVATWLNIGWYRRVGSELERIGGHWVTVVEAAGSPEADAYWMINDPSPRAGSSDATHRLTLKAIRGGRLVGKNRGLPRSADGLYAVTGIALKRGADVALLDGAVRLTLE